MRARGNASRFLLYIFCAQVLCHLLQGRPTGINSKRSCSWQRLIYGTSKLLGPEHGKRTVCFHSSYIYFFVTARNISWQHKDNNRERESQQCVFLKCLFTQGSLRPTSKKLLSAFHSIYFYSSRMCSPSLHPSAAHCWLFAVWTLTRILAFYLNCSVEKYQNISFHQLEVLCFSTVEALHFICNILNLAR